MAPALLLWLKVQHEPQSRHRWPPQRRQVNPLQRCCECHFLPTSFLIYAFRFLHFFVLEFVEENEIFFIPMLTHLDFCLVLYCLCCENLAFTSVWLRAELSWINSLI